MKKIKYLTLIIILAFTWTVLFAQSEGNRNEDNNCKELLKNKEQIINAYLADSTIEENEKVIYEIYLDCGIQTLINHYTCPEIAELILLNVGDIFAVLENLDEEITDSFNLCIDDELGPYKFSDLREYGFKNLFKICQQFVSSDSITFANIDSVKFCNCFTQKIVDREITYSYFYNEFMDELIDESSVVHNEIYLDCYYKSEFESNSEGRVNDIDGPFNIEEIEIYDYGSKKIKVAIGDHEKYFELDTGAEETVITQKMFEKLQKDGLIIKYLGDDIFSLADGSKVLCRQMIVNNFQIGNFTVNNVMVIVPKEGEGSFLLGLSFLNKFKWSIDADRSKLIMVKK